MFAKLKPYRKAILAALGAGLAMFLKADADDVITRAELIEMALMMLGSGGITWAVPNAPLPAKPKAD